MSKLEAVILDWDGVLADSGPHVFEFQKSICAKTGRSFPLKSYGDFRDKVFDPFPRFYQEVLGFDWERDKCWITNEFKVYMNPDKYVLQSGAKSFLSCFGNGVKLGIASSNLRDVIHAKLAAEGLDHVVKSIVGYSENIRPKPYPDALIECADALQVDTSHCLYVGDMPTDAHAARDAKMQYALVSWGLKAPEYLIDENPNFFAQSFDDLLVYITQANHVSSI
ncbi:MAG: HAD family hydrolase [Nanoarchaeota archaeon]